MYHLSEADILSLAYDCLYAVWNMNERLTTRTPFIHNYYLIPYCRRPDRHEQQLTHASNQHSAVEYIQHGVTAEHLLN